MSKYFSTTALVSLLATTGPALAEITADEIWAQWQTGAFSTMMSDATATRDGATLTIGGMKIVQDDADGALDINMGKIALTDRSDGTVSITVDPAYPIQLTDDDDDVTVDLIVRSDSHSTIASGNVDAINYDFSAQSISIDLADVNFPDLDGDLPVSGSISINAPMGGFRVARANDVTSIASAFTADSLVYDFAFDDEGSAGTFSANISAIASTSATKLPAGIDFFDPAAMTNPDYSGTSEFSYGATAMDVNIQDEGIETAVQVFSNGGAATVSFGQGAFAYDGASSGLAVSVTTPDLPFPVNITLAGSGFRMEMPLVASDDARDLSLGVTLQDLAVNNGLWNLFDPGAVLPRDPATLEFDLNGKARWLIEILDPEAMAAVGYDEMPGELTELALSNLKLAVAGALLTGKGAFTFDNTDLETFYGFPRPEGALDVSLVGANGLIDNLIQMGLLPEDQAMGARMMMGLFMTPSADDDTLTSKIEVNELGHVSANGQRLR